MKRSRRLEVFVLVSDVLSLSLSYFISSYGYLLVFKEDGLFYRNSFGQTFVIFLAAILLTNFLTLNKNMLFLKRNKTEEFYNIIKNSSFIIITFATIVFLSGYSDLVSRGVVACTGILFLFMGYANRLILRKAYKKIGGKNRHKLLVVAPYDFLNSSDYLTEVEFGNSTEIIGFAVIDKDCIGETLSGHEVVANFESLAEYSRLQIVDSVLIVAQNDCIDQLAPIVEELQSMGIIVHFGVDVIKKYAYFNTHINYVGNVPVLSYSESLPSEESLILKRIVDIISGLFGSLITLIVTLILGPIIKLESPGPVFFKQKRVGKNGRYFYIYKFRSMGVDAEARKKDLMSQNEVDGHMFKMTNDPRVTKVGKFIRATSIDELPQFFNVLKGDMSLVGTRPPTIEEFKQYRPHHKRRLSMKPGITGMWQVSGRSNITDFEEVVRLDTEYIDNYTLGLDFKIIAKTFIVVFAKIGSK